MHEKITQLLTLARERKLYTSLAFITLFAIAATLTLTFVKAGTSTVSIEAEAGQVAGNAKKGADTNASGGQYVSFQAGSNPGGTGGSGIQIPGAGTLLGIFSDPNTAVSSSVPVLEQNIGRKFDMRMRFYSTDALMPQLGGIKNDIANSGQMQVVSWEPSGGWPSDQQVKDVDNALKSDKPVQIRFAHEMNGNWYKWSQGSTDDYKANWRRVYGLVKGIAPNVLMNWAPFAYNIGKPYDQYYPGDQYVDIVGIDLYVEQPGASMSSTVGGSLFDQIYNTYSGKKPFMVMETNSGPRKPTGHYTNKTAYYNDMVGFLQKRPKISGVVIFDENKWDTEGADMSIAKTPNGGDNAANMNSFVNMSKNCQWGTDAIQKACKGL
jgi:hypothetical protein